MNNFVKAHTRLMNTQLLALGISEEQQTGIDIPIVVNLNEVESFYPYPDEETGGFKGTKFIFGSGECVIVVEDFKAFENNVFPVTCKNPDESHTVQYGRRSNFNELTVVEAEILTLRKRLAEYENAKYENDMFKMGSSLSQIKLPPDIREGL